MIVRKVSSNEQTTTGMELNLSGAIIKMAMILMAAHFTCYLPSLAFFLFLLHSAPFSWLLGA